MSTGHGTVTNTAPAILICTLVDGSVLSLDGSNGQVISRFTTGRPLVSASSPSTIVPDLDGALYMRKEEQMQLLPMTIQDVLNSPVRTCVGSECGIVTATKITSLYGLETRTGHLVWTSHTQSLERESHRKVAVLQREDFVVQQISTQTGDQVWNVTLGKFSALDFEAEGFLPGEQALPRIEGSLLDDGNHDDDEEYVEGPQQEHQSAGFIMPPIAFDEHGLTLSVLLDDGVLWRRRLPSVIARVYGIKGDMWAPLEVVEEPPMHENGLVPLLPEPTFDGKHLQQDVILDLLIRKIQNEQQTGIVVYQPSVPFSSESPRIPEITNILPMIEGESCAEEGSCAPDIPQPQTMPAVRINEPQTRRSVSEGLFLTWNVVFGILFLVMASVVGLYLFYQKKKRKWLATPQLTPQQSLLVPEAFVLGRESSMPEPAHGALLNTNPFIKRSVSLPAMHRDGSRGPDMPSSRPQTPSDEDRAGPTTSITEIAEESELTPQQPSSIDGLPLVRYSRYQSEFKELSALGKGGFGTVFECENVLDGRKYAIKKVGVVVYDDPEVTRERLQRVLREVKILAVLDHPNIVRYYTAWLELEEGGNHDFGDDFSSHYVAESNYMSKCYSSELLTNNTYTTEYHDRPSERPSGAGIRRKQKQKNPLGWNNFMNESFSRTNRESSVQTSLDDLGFTFERSGSNHETDSSFAFDASGENTSETRERPSDDEDEDSQTFSNDENTMNGNTSFSTTKAKTCASRKTAVQTRAKPRVRHTLYIQMQLCSQKTIGDFLSNKEARRGSELDEGAIDIPYAFSLFTQVAQGVKFIHQQSLIHRDLKPSNCFLDDSGVVKVGDFGLSRGSTAREDSLNGSSVEELDLNGDGDNTAGVGTRSYASPEQMNGSDYDASTDVYSLAIILFELCYPMYTGMERHIVFSKVRALDFPESWSMGVGKAFPSLHTMLCSMLSSDPCRRPSAVAVANHMKSLMGQFTVLSIDKSYSERGATLLRIEADPSDGLLSRTIRVINDAAPHVKIEQYGLRGEGENTIIEFALSNTKGIESTRTILANIKSCEGIKVVRQVSNERHHEH